MRVSGRDQGLFPTASSGGLHRSRRHADQLAAAGDVRSSTTAPAPTTAAVDQMQAPGGCTAPAPTWQPLTELDRAAHHAPAARCGPARRAGSRGRRTARGVDDGVRRRVSVPACTTLPANTCTPSPMRATARRSRTGGRTAANCPTLRLHVAADVAGAGRSYHARRRCRWPGRIVSFGCAASTASSPPSTGTPHQPPSVAGAGRRRSMPTTVSTPAREQRVGIPRAWPPAPMTMTGGLMPRAPRRPA